MSTVLLVIHLLIALALICVILLQRSAQDGGGLMGGGGGGGTMGGLFTARGSANLLSRTTAILATIFIVLSLALGILASQQHKSRGQLVEQARMQAEQSGKDAANVPASQDKSEPTKPEAQKAPAVPVSK